MTCPVHGESCRVPLGNTLFEHLEAHRKLTAMPEPTPRIAIKFVGGYPYEYKDWGVLVDGTQVSSHHHKILAKLKARRLRKTLPPDGLTEVIVP